ncbi:metallophosphoesterase [Dyadobacter sp. CY356]|uniref:metallophosphoesterase n=1 Tax=Dyadobacter sp. CY356 TaxID=2906442 RepID=UPI001F22ADA2|nr:metallophosphoesterase [Dyadobacter sp. CY356]MCF0057181.1 metallophosphoesterase [Dyadobacter sp. CY356]
MNWFLVVAIFIFSLLFLFLGFRLTGIGHYSWWVAAVSISILLLYPLVWYSVLSEMPDKVLRAVVHFDMGLLGIVITFILIRDLIFLPVKLFKPDWAIMAFSMPVTLMIAAAGFGVLLFGYWKASQGPEIVKIRVPIANLPLALEKFTILQISDLHAGAGINRAYVENVVGQVISFVPDVIVLTGDIADGEHKKYKNHVQPLSRLTGHAPVLYITGNHEYLRDSEKWIEHFRQMGFQILLNQHTLISKGNSSILFAGITDPAVKEIRPEDGPDIEQALLASPVSDIKILLAHQPKIASEASKHFDLQLSGHTHAGQFFPWNMIIKLLQPYSAGLKKCGPMWVYTNAGTGFWGPPLRIGTTSEITILELGRM